jgi:hypothetical protein
LRDRGRERLEHQDRQENGDDHRRADGDELPFERHQGGVEKSPVRKELDEILQPDVIDVRAAQLAVLQQDVDRVDRRDESQNDENDRRRGDENGGQVIVLGLHRGGP